MKTLAIKLKEHAFAKEIGFALVLSILISLCSKVVIPLPFTPIPMVFQNILCLATGLFFGKRIGALTVVFFLFQGMIGLPVFSSGNSGLAYFFGPTCGYFIGYLVGTYLTGYLLEKRSDAIGSFISLLVGMITIYFFGVSYLSLFLGIKQAILLGVVPFLLMDMAKILFFLGITQVTKKAA